MAAVKIPEQKRTLLDLPDIVSFLAPFGITYEQWRSKRNVPAGAPADVILSAYADKIDELKRRGGYATADVIDVVPSTPNLDVMLAKFSREHWHDEDEVRFIVEGRGLFHISPPGGPVFAIEVEAGDLISVPRGTLHWFDLCSDRRIRAIRLFQDTTGWTPHYTDSGIDKSFQPVCFGASYISEGDIPARVTVSLSALHIRAIVLDIEGTTTPVDFVYQVLFPFARAHVAEFLKREWESAACREAVALLRSERTNDARGERVEPRADLAEVVAYVYSLMDRDMKSRGLKMLQGLIWQDGYRSGDLHGEVYPDVPPALARWQTGGLATYIYSSGSVLAQRLIFGTTGAGDLTTFLRGYFDTEVGPKASVESYRRIAGSIGISPAEIVFVSDVATELDAARAAGMRTALCVRADAGMIAGPHPVIHTFDEIID